MAARVLTLVDAQVTRIAALVGATADVSREYDTPVEDKDLKALTGRKVWVFPVDYDTAPLNRGEDLGRYTFLFVVVERYTAGGPPTKVWLDERVLFAQSIFDLLEDARTGSESAGWCESVDGRMPVYDPAALREQSIYWATSPVFTYRMAE